jgi:5,10-methylenetetrahydromethanopterin reductase
MAFTEVWAASVGLPGYTVRAAQRAEADGFDGMGVVDSQNLAADPYIELALAAHATTTLKLGTAVTNPLTRHPAAAATAIATVQAESGGRAVLGIGRGDSALAHLGLSPAPVAVFRDYVERLQGYLNGEDVPFDTAVGDHKPIGALGLAAGPSASRIHWLNPAVAKVPVDVAATGPKVIALAAELADRVTFAVGADDARIKWAVDLARSINPDADLGAYIPVFVHPDRAAARRLIKGGVASFARFSVMHGRVVGPADDSTTETLQQVHDAYDMERHFTDGSPQSGPLTDDVIDAFGIAGPADYCIDRLSALADLGLTRVFIMLGSAGLDRDEARAARHRLVDEVLPELPRARARVGGSA